MGLRQGIPRGWHTEWVLSLFPPLYIAYDVEVYDVIHILAEVIKKKDVKELIAYECSQVV